MRRLISFINSSKEIVLAVNPFLTTIINVVVMTILFSSFPDMGVNITQSILQVYFPILIQVGYITSIGMYLLATTQDRYDKTRYLLNFAGMRSTAYYLGIFLADFLIFMASNILIIISIYIL